jgi:hypothetical protein
MVHENRRKAVLVVWAVLCVLCASPVGAQEKPAIAPPQAEPGAVAAAKANTVEPFAWNRDGKYVPPDYEGYFVKEDPAAVRRLDDFLSSEPLREKSPDEFLDVVRRGLRSTKRHKTVILGMVGNMFIWNISPQNAAAIELMYHASGSTDVNVAHAAMYHGPTVVVDRSDNLIRMMMLHNNKFDGEIRERIHWGLKTYGDQKKTARQLAKLLDEHEQIGTFATLAAYDAYKKLTGEKPPQPERFANLGVWAIGFHRGDVPAREQKGPDVLRGMLREDLKLADDKRLDFVGRIDGDHWVGVALVSGLAEKERLAEQINRQKAFALDFIEPLGERLLQNYRLGEFAKHWPKAISHAAPAYTLPPLDAVYSWNRKDRHESPDFAKFFPDDKAAGKRLDDLVQARERPTLSDRELLEAFRQGLRRSSLSPNGLFGWLSRALGWPSDPRLTEIFYQAADPAAPQAIRYNSVYFGLGNHGLGNRRNKNDNVLRLFARILATEPYDHSLGNSVRQRILWSVRNIDSETTFLAERIAETLGKHRDLDFLTLIALDGEYRELTGKTPANRKDYEERGAFVVGFRRADVQTISEMTVSIALHFATSKHYLALDVKERQNQIVGLVAVRGAAGLEWLISELQKDKANMIDIGYPLSKNSIVGTELGKIEAFKPFVVDDAAPAKKP